MRRWMVVVFVLASLLFASCGGPTPDPPIIPTPNDAERRATAEAAARLPPPTATPTFPPRPTHPPTVPPLPSAQVLKVVDGDTVDVLLDSKEVRLRLIGIDTPEVVDPRKPVECFGREGSAKAKELLDGQMVRLEADPSQDDADKYGRLLRYIWLADGRLFNQELIAQGYAFEYTYNTPYRYQAQFKEAQRAAREAQVGLWAPSTCNGQQVAEEQLTPTAQPQPAAAPLSTAKPQGTCDPAYPDVCIPPPPPDLDCGDIPHKRFRVLPPDPHRFDGNTDGMGCEQ